jgi:hypothetical protein
LGKIAQGTKEVALSVLSGLVGVETPSLTNCKSHIEVHKVKIAELEGRSHKISKLIPKAMDTLEGWGKKQPSNVLAKAAVKTKIQAMEFALDKMLNAVHKINDAINRANERQGKFEKALEAMTKGLPGWLQYVQTGVTVVIDVSLAIADASKVLEGALAVIEAAEVDIASVALDKI